jgi:hypothetical protein
MDAKFQESKLSLQISKITIVARNAIIVVIANRFHFPRSMMLSGNTMGSHTDQFLFKMRASSKRLSLRGHRDDVTSIPRSNVGDDLPAPTPPSAPATRFYQILLHFDLGSSVTIEEISHQDVTAPTPGFGGRASEPSRSARVWVDENPQGRTIASMPTRS